MLKINNIDASNGISINRYVSGIWLEQCRKNKSKSFQRIIKIMQILFLKINFWITLYCCVLNLLYRSKCCNETLTLQGLLGDIKILLYTLKYNATKYNKLNEFEMLWKNWLLLM